MADNAPAEAAGASSPLVRNLIVYGLMILVPGLLGLLTFNFVVLPMLGGAAPAPEVHADRIPPGEVYLEFTESQATLIPDNPDVAAPVLMFQVSLACNNQATFDLINGHLTRFTAMIAKLHRNRTRQELNDPFVQDTILRQIRDESNALLKRLAPEAMLGVSEAFYGKFTIFDL